MPFVQANGIRIHYLDEGSGPLVVLLHGFPELSITWHAQLRALAAAGDRVVAPDQRGYGQTDCPEPIDAYTILHLVGDVISLIDALGEQTAAVIGHDWGANVAWHVAQLRPDRVRGVAGLSVPPRARSASRPIEAMRRIFGDNYYIVRFQEPGAPERELEADIRGNLLRLMVAASGDSSPEHRWNPVREQFATNLHEPAAVPAWLGDAQLDALTVAYTRTGFRGGINWYRNIDRNWELTAAFAGLPIRQPSLFMIGELDPTLASARPAIEAIGQNAPGMRRKVILPGCGHWIGEERPAEVNTELIGFLQGL
jgi:pimeloyl-ACP methyl ester carboxylesterase